MFQAVKDWLGLSPQLTPSTPMVSAIGRELEYTPDNWYLSQFQYQLVFIYDGMKERMPNHEQLGELTIPTVQAFTKDKFSVFKQKMGRSSYPIPLEKEYKTVPFLPLRGELHRLTTRKLKELDILRRNGKFFQRKRVVLYVPYRERLSRALCGPMQVQAVKAWMYVGITEAWDGLLDGGYEYGVVQDFRVNRNKDISYFPHYYNFTNKEYED